MNTDTAILEIRPAAGGEEAKIWVQDLARMYTRFANSQDWKLVRIEPAVIKIKGPGVFEKLKFEAGVHRVQRIPGTERRGRIHTSTATVAVLPEIPESELYINPQDLQWQFFRASGKGGQFVQKVSTAVRLKHIPSGIIVTSQQERSQEQNRQIALGLLRSKLFARQEEEKERTVAGYRSAIGRGMRSEKIRTYNFPQSRITDHRLKKSWKNLEKILEGKLDKIYKTVPKKAV